MNFPLEQPLYHFFYWLVNTPGVGSGLVGLIVGGAVVSFGLTLRWIFTAKDPNEESTPYPPRE